LQRLPPNRIQRADKAGEIDLEEYPPPACLGARDDPALRARANLLGVHVQEGRGFLEVQRAADEGESWASGGKRLWVRVGLSRGVVRSVDAHVQPWVWFRSLGDRLSRMDVVKLEADRIDEVSNKNHLITTLRKIAVSFNSGESCGVGSFLMRGVVTPYRPGRFVP
jgi:hypothetical protein